MRIALLLACSSIVLAASPENKHPSQVAGIYEGSIPVKGADARKLTLTLQQDGKAEWRDAGKRTPGEWAVAKQTLELRIQGSATPLEWHVKGNLLSPKDWDRELYGKRGPILRRPR